jgi:hypothetical protein
MAVGDLNKSFSVSSKPAWCSETVSLTFDIPDSDYPFLDAFAEGLEKINALTGDNGVIGKLVNTLKGYACEVSTVPGALTFFAEKLATYIENRRSIYPTASVNRMFNLISFIGNKFIDSASKYEGQYFNESNSDYPCYLYYWNQGKLSIKAGISVEFKLFPPKPQSISGGIACASIDCWGCFTGLSQLFTLKRDVLDQNTTSNNSTQTIGFVSEGFSSSELSTCVKYTCNKGTWNENVCVCVCNDAAEVWTPQYGCYSSSEYEKGNAPPGANPHANPNNPQYDPTVDPYSPKYDPSKDPNPYYNPYELATEPSGSSVVLVCVLLLLSVFF